MKDSHENSAMMDTVPLHQARSPCTVSPLYKWKEVVLRKEQSAKDTELDKAVGFWLVHP